jgi:hypothetical protein
MLRRLLFRNAAGKVVLLLAFGLGIGLALFEGICQVISLNVYSQWQETRYKTGHYYQPSTDARLAFELKRNFFYQDRGKVLYTNTFGFREKDDDRAQDKARLAILGDSVVFGTDLDQDHTIPAQVQQKLDPAAAKVRVINAGVPGYGLEQMPVLLQQEHGAYRSKAVVYVLNLNDFTLRDTRFEGADDGLYKMYAPPTIKGPWFIRKAIYRFKKPAPPTNLAWYRWMYWGTRQACLERLDAMAEFCKTQGISFGVVVMPSRHAYDAEGKAYALDDLLDDLKAHAKTAGIALFDPRDAFRPDPKALIDDTDHFSSVEGTSKMAAYIVDQVLPVIAPTLR